MKRLTAMSLALLLLLSFSACGDSDAKSDELGYNLGYAAGYSVGYAEGYAAGESGEPSAPDGAPTDAPTQETDTKKEPPSGQQTETAYEITYEKALVWETSYGSAWLQTVIEITNTGEADLYLNSGSYDLEDESGKLIASRTYISAYPQVLQPGETGYMYEETTLDNIKAGMALTVLERPDIDKAKVDCIRYDVTETELSDQTYGGLKMLGRVENTSDEAADYAYIVAFLYDASGTLLGLMYTVISEKLEPGDKIGFEISGYSLPESVTADEVADYVVFAYPNQYQY